MADPKGAQKNTNDSSRKSGGDAPTWLAGTIIIFSLLIILILALAAIVLGTPAKDILTIVLPVIGAWVGTVLAFYFGKENYAAAARSTRELVGQLGLEEKLKTILADSVMIPIDKADKLVLDKEETEVKLKTDMIDTFFDGKHRNRLPILDAQGRIKYMVHRSIVDKFIVRQVAQQKPLDDLTLGVMLSDSESAQVLKGSFGTVRATSNLADAKAIIDRVDICLDVFVTEDGTANTKVLGWITNVIVTEQSKL